VSAEVNMPAEVDILADLQQRGNIYYIEKEPLRAPTYLPIYLPYVPYRSPFNMCVEYLQ
jgi:hypothetical protein